MNDKMRGIAISGRPAGLVARFRYISGRFVNDPAKVIHAFADVVWQGVDFGGDRHDCFIVTAHLSRFILPEKISDRGVKCAGASSDACTAHPVFCIFVVLTLQPAHPDSNPKLLS